MLPRNFASSVADPLNLFSLTPTPPQKKKRKHDDPNSNVTTDPKKQRR